VNDVVIREATPADAEAIRSLVTRALLSAGFPAPTPELDNDLLDLSYYAAEGRRMLVAEREDTVVGCAAVDSSEDGVAVLRRLSGGALGELTDAALAFARTLGSGAIETVLPPGLPGTQEALQRAGFTTTTGGNAMLLRREL